MSQNFHTPIVDGQEGFAATVNTPLSTLDAAITSLDAEVVAAAGGYGSLDARMDAITIAGGNISTLANGVSAPTNTNLTVDSTAGFIAGARISFLNMAGLIEYRLIATVTDATHLLLSTAHTGVPDNALVSMISESEYQASVANIYGGTATATLPNVIDRLERDINVKAFGAIGDDSSHLVGAGAALTAAQAAFPLTHAARTNGGG